MNSNISGVLGLAPGGEGNYYGNLITFLRATGKIRDDNFAFSFTDSGKIQSLLIALNMGGFSKISMADLPAISNRWELSLMWTNIENQSMEPN